MTKRGKGIAIVVLSIIAIFFSGSLTNNASAVSFDDVFIRMLINNTKRCYEQALVNELSSGDYKDEFNSLMVDGAKMSDDLPKSPYYFLIPSVDSEHNHIEAINSDGGRATSCHALFMGDKKGGTSLDGNMQGLFDIYNKKSDVPLNTVDLERFRAFMVNTMQYAENRNEVSEYEICYTVIRKDGAADGQGKPDINIGTYCRPTSDFPWSNNYHRTKPEVVVFSGGSEEFYAQGTFDDELMTFSIDSFRENIHEAMITCEYGTPLTNELNGLISYDLAPCYYVGVKLSEEYSDIPIEEFYEVKIEKRLSNNGGNDSASNSALYIKGDNDAYKGVLSSITNGAVTDRIKFTPTDKHEFYKLYIKEYYSSKDNEGFFGVCQSDKPGSLLNDGYWIYDKSSGQWCTVRIDPNSKSVEHAMTVFSEGQDYVLDKVIKTLPELIELMGALDVENDDSEPTFTPTPAPDNGDDYKPDPCYAGSGGLGWILCPVITAVTGVGEHMWEQIETHHLQVPAQAIFGNDSGVYKAWEMMRGIANTIFLILFLFVIFSQLTGFGIDNYGVKKILPKLIIVAVLINLSYLICELAVDLSNIFGKGLNDLFSDMAKNVFPESFNKAAIEAGVGSQITGWIAALGLLGGGTFLFALIQSGGGIGGAAVWIGLLVLGIVITIVMAMLTLYLVLIIREAGIILLVVLSPVAVVCNLLPNTDKIYKKWFGMFKALLIVYPICGAMVGAGKLAGSILATIDSESMRLAAMIVQVLPFFLIPSMLKSSLALMGNIGAKVSSLGKAYGKKASGGATGMIRNSERFKNLAQRQKDEKAVRMANRVRNRYKGRVNLNDRQRRRLYAANQTINQDRMTSAAARAGAFELTADAALRRAEASRDAQEQKAFSEEFNNMDTAALEAEIRRAKVRGSFNPNDRAGVQRMSALLQTMEARGKQKDIFDILRNNNLSDSSKVMQTLQASNNKVLKAYGKKGEGVSYNAFMTGTGPSSLSGYISEKGASFVDGIDDKALQEIKNQNVGAMGADLWVQAAARTNSQDAINVASKAVEEQIASGAFAGSDMGITADSFTTMNKTMAEAILEGYRQDYARTNPGLSSAQIDAEARSVIASVFNNQINAANNDVNIKSKVGQEVGEVFRINNGP